MKKFIRVAAIVVAVLLMVALALPFLIDANQFRPALETRISAALGREVKLGDLKLSLFSGGVSASNLTVADDPAFSKSHFLTAKTLSVGVEMIPLIMSRKLNVTGLTIEQPEISLLQTPEGKWNFSSLGAKSETRPAPVEPAAAPNASGAAPDLSVKLVKITDGRFTLGMTAGRDKPRQLEKLSIELSDFSAGSSFPFSLSASVVGGGEIKLKGKAGPIPTADAAETPFDASLTITRLNLAASGFTLPSSGVAGLISIDGTAASNGKQIKIRGKLTADDLKISPAGSPAKRPIQIELALTHDMDKRDGVLEPSAIRIGKAEAHLAGTYSLTSESPVIKMKLDGPNMPLPELLAILPALDVVLPGGSSLEGGTASVALSSQGSFEKLTTTGSLSVDKTRLMNFDLGGKLKILESLAGIPGGRNTDIETLSANVTAAPAGTDIRDIKFVAPAIGELSGAGTISPKHALDFQMRAILHTSGMVTTLIGTNGGTGVPFRVEGTSENPTFKADMKGVAKEKLQQITKDPSKAVDAAKGIMNLFRKAPPESPPPQK